MTAARLSHAKGVSLVELVCALVILAISGFGILHAYLSSQLLAESASTTMRASDDLQDMLEGIHSVDFADIQSTFPAGVADGGGVTNYAALVGGYTLQNEQITVTYPTAAAGRIEVLVTVNWTFQNRAKSMAMSTLRTG